MTVYSIIRFEQLLLTDIFATIVFDFSKELRHFVFTWGL